MFHTDVPVAERVAYAARLFIQESLPAECVGRMQDLFPSDARGVGARLVWAVDIGGTALKAARARGGDRDAQQLMDTAVLVTAVAARGLFHAFGLPPGDTAVICHGGAFSDAAFSDRFTQILDRYPGREGDMPSIVATRALALPNACLAGARRRRLSPIHASYSFSPRR
ncbi:hypothetical protein M1555_03835 [Patescibacteria group bacterium]|nr:hypothetical protein [Patescibacteria group bacterium]